MTMVEPWIKVKVGLIRSDKIARLPNGDARWGWVKALAEAKLQRRMGVFASRRHLAELLGPDGRYVRDYVRVGLAHDVPEEGAAWPEGCTERRCDRYYRADTQPGELVVHDFRLEQRDPTNATRQEDWRNGGRNAPRNAGRNGGRNAPRNDDVTTHSRALSPSPSMSLESLGVDEPYQVGDDAPDDSDALLSWLALTHRVTVRPGNGWHVRVMNWFAQGATLDAAKDAITAAVEGGGRLDRQVIPAAEDILFPRQQPERLTPAERRRRDVEDTAARIRAEARAAGAAKA